MALQTIHRRLTRLEGVFVPDLMAGFPPLSDAEIVELVERLAGGDGWTDLETARITRHCPYIQGELMITRGISGEVIVKRYPGLDMATDV